MKTVSKQASLTLGKLIEAAKATGQDYVKIDNNGLESGIMPVTVERVYRDCAPKTELWAVAHWYTQNGDAMRDPEVVYAVPVIAGAPDYTFSYPIEYRQDNLGIHRHLVRFDGGKIAGHCPAQQADTATFTTGWMRNIKAQQNIK